ncbi:MAG: hypothetical protein E2P01_02260 [Acidobacteria bacterium]|nr:MAG: hypothetical protein E2P01_02260 [Acidobacteriota bacterium]
MAIREPRQLELSDSYDTAIIGSSPISLLEALYRAGKGEEVVVLDDKSVLGGAWDFISMAGYTNVESCSHILRYHPGCYRFLEKYLGLKMIPMDPPPLGYSCRNSRPPKGFRYETWRWKLQYISDRIDHAGLPRTWERFENDVLRPCVRGGLIALDRLRGREAIQEYPVGGTPAMVESLRNLIRRSNVSIRLNHLVKYVESRNGRIQLLADDSKLVCDNLVMTTQTRLCGVHSHGTEVPRTGKDLRSIQLMLLLYDPSPIGCSFLEFNGHPFLRRVSDVTRYTAQYCESGRQEKIISVTYRLDQSVDDELIVKTMTQLKDLGVTGPGAEIKHHEWHSYPTTLQKPVVMEQIQNLFGSQLNVLWTIDLALAIEMYAPRWQTSLRPYQEAVSPTATPIPVSFDHQRDTRTAA